MYGLSKVCEICEKEFTEQEGYYVIGTEFHTHIDNISNLRLLMENYIDLVIPGLIRHKGYDLIVCSKECLIKVPLYEVLSPPTIVLNEWVKMGIIGNEHDTFQRDFLLCFFMVNVLESIRSFESREWIDIVDIEEIDENVFKITQVKDTDGLK